MTHKTEPKVSRFCSVLGCAFNLTSTTTALLGLFLPFWVYVNDVLETNTYDLTENTNVIYNYDWEKMTLVSVASGAGLNALSFLLVVLHSKLNLN
ncbi:hypothetical protein MAR_018509 [Mya arenaria]|uniref:Uncharacterized protein n=1 Tax=Mya arenaria TaxID=6604 RepID=A0ABY7EIC1_MYAAR|nr:hypothetical protein MAR_018509 [Mya arenaria]